MDDLTLLKDMADRTPLPSAADLDPARARLMAAITTRAPQTDASPVPARATADPASLVSKQAISADTARTVSKDATSAGAVRPGLQEAAPGGAPSVISEQGTPVRSFRRRRLLVSAAAAVGLAAAITGAVALGGLAPVGVEPQSAEAAEILHQAAAAVRTLPDTPPRADQFVYTRTQRVHESVREAWLSADGTHDSMIRQEGLDIPLPGCRDGRAPAIKGTEPLPGQFEPCTPSPAYRADLPTDVAGMRAYLNQDTGGDPDVEEDVSGLIRMTFAETYVPPASLAALFEVMADFPGLTVVDDAVDAAGREGIGVSWTRDGETETLVFDRRTHAFLGVTGSDAVIEQAIVDTVGQRP